MKQKNKRIHSVRYLMTGFIIIIGLVAIIGSGGGGGGGDGTPPDNIAPTVINTSPSDGEINVPVNSAVSVNFSETMNSATISTSMIRLMSVDGTSISGSLTYSDQTAIFTPSSPLPYESTFTLIISANVTDLAGNPLASEFRCSFTTEYVPDFTPPNIISTDPAADATDIRINSTISVNFSEEMDPFSINTSSLVLKDSDNNQIGVSLVDHTGAVVTFTLDNNLEYNTTYTATISTEIRDLAGNTLVSDYFWSFTTEASYTFTVNIIGTGSGSVVSTPAGINCGLDCTEAYISGTDITLSATQDAGSVFEGFSGACNSITPTCHSTLTGDASITAIFNTISVSAAGNQLGLDGIDDVAVSDQRTNPPTSPLDLSTFTIEAWVFPLANSTMIIAADSAYYLMVKPQAGDNPLRVELAVMTATGFPAFMSFAGTINPFQLNQWNHVAGMFSNSTRNLRLAINGELSGTITAAAALDASYLQSFSVGNSYPEYNGDFPFVGRIDEVRLSSSVRYNDNFPLAYLFTPDATTIGLWHFDEAEGATTFADSSGHGYTLWGLNGASTIAGTRVINNSAPVANAGSDKNYLNGTTVILDGSNSTDADLNPLTYFWSISSKPEGSNATLSDFTVDNPTFIADVNGLYEIRLVVNDGIVDSTEDIVTITAMSPGVPTGSLPDTGQATSYTTIFGEDSDYGVNLMSFSDNTDGTVTDNLTGLMWQQGDADSYNWYEASGTPDTIYNPEGRTDICGALSLGGYTDWRLPTKKEQVYIADYGTYSPAIDTTFFPGTQTSIASSYWSSTSAPFSTLYQFAWGSLDGRVMSVQKIYSSSFNNVRCVRGNTSQAQDFIDNGDGTITDLNTGLMWQQNDDNIVRSWESAIGYCEGLSLAAQSDWRLPNIKELESIIDDNRYDPTINIIYFSETNSSDYWSSTTRSYTPDLSFSIDFQYGRIGGDQKTENLLTRCVR